MQLLNAYKLGQTSIILRVKLFNSSVTTQAGLTALTSASAGLIISTIADNEAAATTYTQAGSTIETISTLGTYAAPTATKCRFKEVDATNLPGVYEIQIADARFAVANAKSLTISVLGATNLAQAIFIVPLITGIDPYMAAPGASTGLLISGTNSGTTTLGALTCTGTFTISGGAVITNSNSNTAGLSITGNGTGHGVAFISGNGATGNGFNVSANSTNGVGMNIAGVGTGAGVVTTGGATGQGMKLVGGSGSGDALLTATTSGHGFNLVATGSSKHGLAGVVETGFDYTQCLQLIAAAVAGKCGIVGDTVTYRDLNDSADRIVATTDGDGQRTAVTKTVA